MQFLKRPQLNEPVSNIHIMISNHKIIYKVCKGPGIICFVTHWVILAGVSSKSIHESKRKSLT